MTWINIVKKIKTIWSKGKYYIGAGIGVVLAIILIVLSRKKGEPWKVFDDTQRKHEKELNIIEESHKIELEKKEKEIKLYHDTVENIEKKHKEQNKQLKAKYKKEVKKIVKKYKEKPDELAKKLSEEFGINYTS